ncbi:MAG: putative GNAT-family acetyltransferase, partial [Pseudarthrobacter sp.]|nr:putative GNAT-family acetyltransferase [Pseudarthrobacter sp.]
MTSAATSDVRAEQGNAAARDAAGITPRATARRDRLPAAPTLEDKLPGIESALAADGALLLIARIEGVAAAFALVIPRVDVLEVLYLAVDPPTWGT